MAQPLDPKEMVTLEELAISGMWETAAIREVLEKKGLLTKPEILDAIRELRRKNPTARTPLEIDDPPEQSKTSPKVIDGNTLIDRILDLILEAGLSPSQAREVFDRARELIDQGEQEAKKMSVH